MTTKLTYWERSPQESTQSARDCTLDRNLKEHLCKQRHSLRFPSTLRYLQQSLTWHGVSSQVSHTLKRLTSTTPQTKQFCKLSQNRQETKILTQHSQRLIQPKLTRGYRVLWCYARGYDGVMTVLRRCYAWCYSGVTAITPVKGRKMHTEGGYACNRGYRHNPLPHVL